MRERYDVAANRAILLVVDDLEGPNAEMDSGPESTSVHPGRRLRVLAVGDVVPWPARDGYRLRFSASINALSEIGDVDLFVGARGEETGVPSPVVQRYEARPAPQMSPSLTMAVRTCVSRLPSRILWRDWHEARARLRSFVREPYDVVWYSHADAFIGLGHPSFGPAVVDLDNLEQNVIRTYLAPSKPPIASSAGYRAPRPMIRGLVRRMINWRDRILWSRLQIRIARSAMSTLVCSEDDRQRLRHGRIVVVPNGYADPGPPMEAVVSAPLLVMVGLFTYEPNLDGARWFAHEVLPTLRQLVPDITVRLVGRHDERLLSTVRVPGITIVGEVDEIGHELRHARGVIIPLLSGSGTRIKALEALAYGMPMVTTKVGSEGLGVVSDIHALVRDDPAEFARACAQILEDDAIVRELRRNGRKLFVDHYEAGSVAERIKYVALHATLSASTPPGELDHRAG